MPCDSREPMDEKKSKTMETITHMLHGAGIFTTIYPMNHSNVSRYTLIYYTWRIGFIVGTSIDNGGLCTYKPTLNGNELKTDVHL